MGWIRAGVLAAALVTMAPAPAWSAAGTEVAGRSPAPAVAAATAAPSPWLPTLVASRHPRTVSVIGDSLTVGADVFGGLTTRLGRAGLKVSDVDAKVGRTSVQGLAILRARTAPLGSVLIVALGTNDVAMGYRVQGFAKRVDAVMQLAGRTREVIWVDVHLGRTPAEAARAAAFNAVLTAKARRYRNLVVASWDRAMQGHDELTSTDRVHLTVQGYRVRAQFLTSLARLVTA